MCGTGRSQAKEKRHLEPKPCMEAQMRRADPGHLWCPKHLERWGGEEVIPSLRRNDTELTVMEYVMKAFFSPRLSYAVLNKIHLLPQKPTNKKRFQMP